MSRRIRAVIRRELYARKDLKEVVACHQALTGFT